MNVTDISELKKLFMAWREESPQDWAKLIDTLTTVKDLDDLTDGSSISLNCFDFQQAKTKLETAESTIALTLSNFGKVLDLAVNKTISGDCTITLQGTGLKFIDMNSKAAPASTIDMVLSDDYNEASLLDSGFTDSGDKVIYAVSK